MLQKVKCPKCGYGLAESLNPPARIICQCGANVHIGYKGDIQIFIEPVVFKEPVVLKRYNRCKR